VNTLRESPTNRTSNIRRLFKYALFGSAAVVLLGLAAPFISVGAYRSQIQSVLEESLGRRVTIRGIHYTLFAGPGFSMKDVTISEDPRYGIEPCAYVPTLIARIRLDKLLTGHLQIAELRLSDPTLNLVKRGDGTWNIVEIFEQISNEGARSWNILPAVTISDARLNFKFGSRKTVFYMDGTDIATYPESTGKIHVRFAGSPSRTDRSAHGFGMVRGEANWYLKPASAVANKLEADLTLERSNLSETITLIEGYDVGIHGTVSSHVVVSGPEGALKVRGDLRLEDIHRWDLQPSSGEDWHVRYQGEVDLLQHKIQLVTVPGTSNAVTPVALQLRVNNFLTAPAWSVLAQFRAAPVQNILPLAARFGIELPANLKATGALNGAVGYSNRSGWNGGLALEDLNASLPNGPVLNVAAATVNVSNDRIHVFPSTARLRSGAPAQVTGDYIPSSRALAWSISLMGTPVESLTEALTSWFGSPPFFPALRAGLVSGLLRYSSLPAEEPFWSGEFQLNKAEVRPPGLALPVHDLNARVLLDGSAVTVPRFTGFVAATRIAGDYHYRPSASSKERISIQLADVDIAQVEKLLSSTLGPQDFFSRFRFGRRSLPSWLASRSMEGDIFIDRAAVGAVPLGALRTHFEWTGPTIQATSLQLRLPEGRVTGHGSVTLANVRPRYSFSGALVDYPWNGGLLNATGSVATTGVGVDALQNLRATGDFAGTGINAADDVTFSRISGNYALSLDGGWPQLKLSGIEADEDEENWQGTGSSDKDGNLLLDLTSGTRQKHIVSSLNFAPKPQRTVEMQTSRSE
jgi:AsmA family